MLNEGVSCWLKKNMTSLAPNTCRTSSARNGVIGVDRSGQDMPGNIRGKRKEERTRGEEREEDGVSERIMEGE